MYILRLYIWLYKTLTDTPLQGSNLAFAPFKCQLPRHLSLITYRYIINTTITLRGARNSYPQHPKAKPCKNQPMFFSSVTALLPTTTLLF